MIKTVIVDDDSLVHVTLRSLVDWEKCGYTVVRDCSGGADAVGFISENPVDLLITDIKMPEVDGLELMRQLRQNGEMPLTVVLSGYDEFELVREAFRLGAYDYLLKSNINGKSLAQLLDGLRENVFTRAGFTLSADPEENCLLPSVLRTAIILRWFLQSTSSPRRLSALAEIFVNVWKSPCWSLYVRYAACRDESSSARKIHRSTSFIIRCRIKAPPKAR